MVCLNSYLVLFCVTVLISAAADNIDRKHVKCLVCHRVVEELFNEIGDISQSSTHEAGNRPIYMPNKKAIKTVQKKKSEIYFDDLMDRLCKKMGEYVRVINKSSGQLEVIPLLLNGKMNLNLGSYEIIKDGDLESLDFYCESIISEYEEEMLLLYKEGASSAKYTQDLCFNPEICKPTESVQLSKEEF